MRQERYDIIVIGSGAGGGTLAHALSQTSARILIVERGDFIPQEEENWDPEAVWKHLRYQTRRSGSTPTAASSRRTATTTSAATASSGAACCTGCGARISRTCSTSTASRRRGRSTTTRWSRTTTAPSGCIRCTAKRASIPPIHAARPLPVSADAAFDGDGGHCRAAPIVRPASVAAAARTARRVRRSATPATRSRARCTRRAKPTSAASGRRCSSQRSRCGPTRRATRLLTNRSGDRVEAVEVERNGETVRVEAPLFVVVVRRRELGGAVAAVGERRASRTDWPIRRAWSDAVTWRTSRR